MDLARVAERESSHMQTSDKNLVSIIESAGDDEALKLLNSRQTFSQAELDTALIFACHCGYKFLLYELVRLGADVQIKDRNGNTPMLISAEKGFTNIVRFFIRRQVDINATNYCGNTALILAIGQSGSVEMVKLLLAQTEINVNHQNKEGYTALMKAIEAMDIDVIKLLLDSQKNAVEVLSGIKNCTHETAQQIADKLGIGTVVKLLSKHENEPLLEAVRICDVDSFIILIDCQFYDSSQECINDAFKEVFRMHSKNKETFNEDEHKIIQKLLERGANMHDHCYGFVDPVLVATKVGSYRVLQLLLQHTAYPELSVRSIIKDSLQVAAENGRIDLMQLLLQHTSMLSVSEFQYSQVECALKNGHSDCARLLIRHGANVDVKYALRSAVSSQLPVYLKCVIENFQAEVRQFANTRDMNDLLVSASHRGNTEIIGMLLDAGADVNCVNGDKKTPLMMSKNAEVVYFLVQRGAVVKKYSRARRDYSSPLTYILSQNYGYHESTTKEKIVEALLKSGAHVNGKSCGGRTPLMIAVSKGESRNMVQMLLDHGALSNMRDNKGNTILLLAAQTNNTENIMCLLEFYKYNKDVVNAQNYEGFTALIAASKNHNLAVVKDLVDHGADVNIADTSGNTALLHAMTKAGGREDAILTTLVTAGSDINYQNNAGLSPLMLASENCMKNVVKLLINLGANVNAVSKIDNNRTALSVMSNNSYLGQETLDCMECLLDQGARASFVSPGVLHKLILQSKTQFIPKLIQCGLGPSEVTSSNMSHYSVFTYYPNILSVVSPLCVAMMTGNVKLAHYFVGNLFMTKSDIHMIYNQSLRQHLEGKRLTECLHFLDEVSANPMSLFTLAFLAVQSAVGSAPGREDRISLLPLPQVMKDRLLFKKEHVKLDTTSTDKSSASL